MMILILKIISFLPTVHCYAYVMVNNTPMTTPKDFSVLQHMRSFLKNIQAEVVNSRVMLQKIDHGHFAAKDTQTTAKERAQDKLTRGGIDGLMDSFVKNNVKPKNLSSSPLAEDPKPFLKMLSNALNVIYSMGGSERQEEFPPGDILAGLFPPNLTTTTEDPYLQTMHHELLIQNAGYLSVAFERLCEQIALKEPIHITAVFKHAEKIVEELHERGRLLWLKDPMTRILDGMACTAAEMPTDELKSYAIMLHFTLVHRRTAISEEVNKLIDFADSFVDAKNGDHLFTVIGQFKNFPNVSKTSKDMCQDIIEAFEMPYRSIKNSRTFVDFIDLANKAFRDRHPQLQRRSLKYSHLMGSYRSERSRNRSNSKKTHNHSWRVISPFNSTILRHTNHKRRNRRMNGDHQAVFATRPQVSLKDYKVSKERYTTRKQIRRYPNSYNNLPEENVIRRLSMENSNYYKDESKEQFGIKKILTDNENDKDVMEETVTRNMKNVYQAFTGEFNVPHRFHLTNRDFKTETAHIHNELVSRKLLYAANTESFLTLQSNDNQQKRFNIINPLGKESHWVDTTEAALQMRRTTQYKKSLIERYRMFDRRTTQFKSHRRANSDKTQYLNLNSNEYLKPLKINNAPLKLKHDGKKIPTSTKEIFNQKNTRLSNFYLTPENGRVNDENQPIVKDTVTHSDEKTDDREYLINQLIYNLSFIETDKVVKASSEIDNVEEMLKRNLYRAHNMQY